MAFVIPFFISHQGCRNRCSFCNQQAITGSSGSLADVRDEIGATVERWLGYRKTPEPVQFAFYGGSFTCLEVTHQTALLEALGPWLASGDIDSLRISTRPDCIDPATLRRLERYRVQTVELGVQSLDDAVLAHACRGHTAEDCVRAMDLLRRGPFRVGMQLMPGLPTETRNSFLATVKKTIDLRPSFVRMYPTLVVAGSELARCHARGDYRPLSLEMAVILTARAREMFVREGIHVVRMGLQHSDHLQKSIVAGPYHCAFGEMVLAWEWFKRVCRLFAAHPGRRLRLTISPRDLSAFNGVNSSNRLRWRRRGLEERMEVVVDEIMERGNMKHAVC